MEEQCHLYLQIYELVPDFSVQLFCKILRMIRECLTQFEQAKLQNRSFHKFYFGDAKLAWDFNIGPIPQQLHGLYARVRFLSSHYLATFEEMMQYGFIEGYLSSCFNIMAPLSERYLAHRLEEVANPITKPPLAPEEQELHAHIEGTLDSVRPAPTQPQLYATPEARAMATILRQVLNEHQEQQERRRVRTKSTQPPGGRGGSSSRR